MIRTVVLAVHIAAGATGLLLGVPAMRAVVRGVRRTGAMTAYEAAVTVVTVTAVVLAAMNWSTLWPFAILAVATEAAVLGATRARGARRVRMLCGSYVSLVTALLVVSWGSVLAWVLPIVVGTVLVERAAA
ncbi:MAG: hypothetical protein M3144_02475, partial [Actinomycetota bacterium]|nr:hypothetical protein [Actinomycetota bacterium]